MIRNLQYTLSENDLIYLSCICHPQRCLNRNLGNQYLNMIYSLLPWNASKQVFIFPVQWFLRGSLKKKSFLINRFSMVTPPSPRGYRFKQFRVLTGLMSYPL